MTRLLHVPPFLDAAQHLYIPLCPSVCREDREYKLYIINSSISIINFIIVVVVDDELNEKFSWWDYF